jgi:hypothetical protein
MENQNSQEEGIAVENYRVVINNNPRKDTYSGSARERKDNSRF